MFFIGQNWKHAHMTFFSWTLIFFWLTLVDIYCLGLFLTISTKYYIWMQTPMETNHEIKTNILTKVKISDQ